VDPAGAGEVGGGGPVAGQAWNLEDRRQVLQARMPEQRPEGGGADQTVARIGVTITVTAALGLGVVQVDAPQPVEADRVVDGVHDAVGLCQRPVLDAGGEEVLGVEAGAKAPVCPGGVEHGCQLAPIPPARPAGAGGVLHQERARG